MQCDKPAADKQETYLNICKSQAYQTTRCTDVKKVNANYGQCTGDINAVSCDVALEKAARKESWLPGTCENVFN